MNYQIGNFEFFNMFLMSQMLKYKKVLHWY